MDSKTTDKGVCMDIIAFIMEHFFQADYYQFYIITGLGLILYWVLWQQSKDNLKQIQRINESLRSLISEMMIMRQEMTLVEKEVKGK